MTYKTGLCSIAAILILSTSVFGAVSPLTESPLDFRNGMHRDFQAMSTIDRIVLPTIISDPQTNALATNFDDVLISETVGPANFTQQQSDIASLKGGRFAAVWEDNRLGPVGVFVQLFSATAEKIDANNSLISGTDFNLSDPHICADTSGYFYVVWREENNGFLQAARFDSEATASSSVFFVSDTIFATYAGDFDAACLPDGKLVVTWENYSLGNDISYRIFNTDGSPASAVLTANSDGSFNKHWSPSIARGSGGDFAIAWEDYRSGKADIYFRRFNAAGLAYATGVSLSDAAARDSGRFMPSLAFSTVDGFVASWVDTRERQHIYIQRISASGALVGANVLISEEFSASANWEVDLGVLGSGYLTAVWTEYGTVNRIVMQRFLNGASQNGSAFVISGSTHKLRFDPAVTANKNNISIVVWTDLRSGSIDVYGTGIGSDGASLGPNYVVNDDVLGSPSLEPAVTTFTPYEWDIVFTDMRRDQGDIMLQRVYVGGDLIGANRRVNADPAGGFQSQPSIAGNDQFLCISWTDVRSDGINGQNIFCRFSQPHYDLTGEIVVNDDHLSSAAHHHSAGAVNNSGISLIVWTDTRQGNAKIYGQLFNATYAKIGANFLIGPDSPARTGETPTISVTADGSFIVIYLNRLASGGPAVEAKQVLTGGAVVDLFAFQSDQSGYSIDGFDADVLSTGTIGLVWHAFSAGGPENFLTLLNSGGSVISPTQAVSDNAAAEPGTPTATVDGNDYLLITWLDNRTGSPTPFRQIYEPSLTPIQSNTPTYSTAAPFMQTPVGAGSRGKGIFVWADARSNGLNIYAAQDIYAPTATDDDDALPSVYRLDQNRPNPFNPTTSIQFSLPKTGPVRLEVLNILGQRVSLLADGVYPAGTHEVVWNGRDDKGTSAASGIYFYRITSDKFSSTRKMVLLK